MALIGSVALASGPRHISPPPTVVTPPRQQPTAVATPRPLTVVATLPVGAKPAAVAVDPATHRAYVTNQGGNTVSVIDGLRQAVVATVQVANQPSGVALDPGPHKVFVANENGDALSVVDTRTDQVGDLVSMGGHPSGVAVDPIAHRVYVTDNLENRYATSTGTVQVIDARSDRVIASATIWGLGSSLSNVAVDPSTHAVYVDGVMLPDSPPTLAALDAAKLRVTGRYIGQDGVMESVGAFGLALDAANHRVFETVPDFGLGLIAFAPSSLIGSGPAPVTIAVGVRPEGAAVDPTTHTVYVADSGRSWPAGPGVNSLSIVDEATDQVIGDVPVGTLPWGVAVDPTTHLVFVANQGSNTVSIIAGLTEPLSGGQ